MDSNELTIVVDGVDDLNDASCDHLIRKLKRTINAHIDDDNPAASKLSLSTRSPSNTP